MGTGIADKDHLEAYTFFGGLGHRLSFINIYLYQKWGKLVLGSEMDKTG